MSKSTSIPGVIDFMKYKWLYFTISAVVIIPGLYALIVWGLKPGIDFTGGTLLEISVPAQSPINETVIKNSAGDLPLSSVQPSGKNTFLIRLKPIDSDQAEAFKLAIASNSGLLSASPSARLGIDNLIKELRFETVGPTLGKELLQKTLIAVLISSTFITLYVAYRFKNLKFGVSAILAMFHDTLVVLGIFALLGHFYGVEVDTLFVTAVLTTLSFSVHDTIVVYDRIREKSRKFPSLDHSTMINVAISETMARSINNSMTIVFMLLALILFGGVTIRWFVLALLIGTVSGTYSSPFVAGPLLLVWDKLFKKR